MSQILSTAQMRQIRADREELERYRLTGLTPEGVVQLIYHYKDLQQRMIDPAPLPFSDHMVEYEGEWCGVTGIPGLLEENE